ncbi:MAG: prenyltransferase/squalene oxidase repeat-containing protein, partial [Planctomycetota bacterium]
KAIESCLAFLVSSQSPNGSWNCAAYGGDGVNTTGVTGLALLALLGDGSVAIDGRRGAAIRKAVEFLEKEQDEEGCFSGRSEMHFIYRHSIATQALAEYAALARETERLGPVLEKAHDFLLRAQQPGKGWRYTMGSDSDTSVTLWAVSALDRLRRAGIEVDDKGFRGAVAWVDEVTESKDGTAGYIKRGTSSARLEKMLEKFPPGKTRALTAAARLIEAYAGRPAGALQAKRMAQVRLLPPDQGCPDMYYWHLGARAFVAGEGMMPAVWWERLWFGVEGHRGSDGSVDPAGPWGHAGGRIYSTAICALSLMAPYAEPGPSFMRRASRFLKEGQRVVVVPADAHDLPTGIYLDKGMELEVEPRGEVVSFKGVRATGPAGHKKAPRGRKRLHKSSPYGCLLARVGRDGRFAAMKKKGRFRAKACGQLFLSMNDERPVDATGQLEVELRLRK